MFEKESVETLVGWAFGGILVVEKYFPFCFVVFLGKIFLWGYAKIGGDRC